MENRSGFFPLNPFLVEDRYYLFINNQNHLRNPLINLWGLSMSKKDDFQERRKHKRFKAKRGAFAVSLPNFDKLGQIENISEGGFAFQYMGDAEQAKDSVEVEIFSTFDDFFLRKLPVKTVSDFEIGTQVLFSSLPTRQVNLQFGELQHHQKTLLHYFLQQYTR